MSPSRPASWSASASERVGTDRRARSTAPPPPSGRRQRVEQFGRIGVALTVIGFLLSVAGVVLRGLAAGRAPWGNMFEFTISAMVFVVGVVPGDGLAGGLRWLGLPVTLLAAIGNGLAVTVFYVAVAPLVPALHSVWFLIHIVAAAIAGAAFNIGGLMSILYLIKKRAERRGHGRAAIWAGCRRSRRIDLIAYRFHAFAFPLWTFTVPPGAIWAEYAWGRYWGWDPKETWALVTWVIYACYLHARSTAGWRGTRAAVIAIDRARVVLVQLRRHQPVGLRPALLRRRLSPGRLGRREPTATPTPDIGPDRREPRLVALAPHPVGREPVRRSVGRVQVAVRGAEVVQELVSGGVREPPPAEPAVASALTRDRPRGVTSGPGSRCWAPGRWRRRGS